MRFCNKNACPWKKWRMTENTVRTMAASSGKSPVSEKKSVSPSWDNDPNARSSLSFRGCSVGAANISLFTTFLLITHRIQDACTPLLQWRWKCSTNACVLVFRAHARIAWFHSQVSLWLQGHILFVRPNAEPAAYHRLFPTWYSIE